MNNYELIIHLTKNEVKVIRPGLMNAETIQEDSMHERKVTNVE